MRDPGLRYDFHQRAVGDLDKSRKIRIGPSAASFSNVRGNRHCCPAQLTCQAKAFFDGKVASHGIHDTSKFHSPLPDLKLFKTEHQVSFQPRAEGRESRAES